MALCIQLRDASGFGFLELCRRAKGVVLDYTSNTSRYFALSHPGGFEAVWNIDTWVKIHDERWMHPPYVYPFLIDENY